MIRTIFSDFPTYKSMSFVSGLNIVLADKSPGATEKQSRNGAGKSSLLETIHFVLGGKAKPTSIFRNETLLDYSFSLELDLYGKIVSATRSGDTPAKIFVSGDVSKWPIALKKSENAGEWQISNENWRLLLGNAFFNLPVGDTPKYSPRFRSLFAYFARSQSSGGFADPLYQASMQQLFDRQVAISALLNLDVSIPRDLQGVRDKEKLISALKKAAKGGALTNFINSAATIRTELAIARATAQRLLESLNAFRVVDEYAEYETEATRLTREISRLNNENTTDLELIEHLKETMNAEVPASVENVERIYKRAGILLPDLVQKRYEDVQAFHTQVIENRKQHLSVEKESAEVRISERSTERKELDIRRQKVMGILSSGGALEHYNLLRADAAQSEANVAVLSTQLEAAETLESTKAELDSDRTRLLAALQADYRERADFIAEAVIAFQDISRALYETGGKLTITPTKNGPEIGMEIPSDSSVGINNMKIFCFDLMMMDLNAKRGIGPGFLIHDSHLFDGVDERQVAKALELGAAHAKEHGYQYIITMNSDAIPSEGFSADFNILEYVNKVRLTDAEESGGLFGVRF